MEYRPAVIQDLPQIKEVFQDIIKSMEDGGIPIWDEVYPCEFFEDDIKENRLYLMTEGEEILSAFALCESNSGEAHITWEDKHAKALYLDRLGVNARRARQGIGGSTLIKAEETAKALGAEYLRLFVVDSNLPAIALYEKSGFTRAKGSYDEVIDEDYILHEYGYEKKL